MPRLIPDHQPEEGAREPYLREDQAGERGTTVEDIVQGLPYGERCPADGERERQTGRGRAAQGP